MPSKRFSHLLAVVIVSVKRTKTHEVYLVVVLFQIVDMKVLAALLLLVAVTASYKIQEREKRFFLGVSLLL